MFVRAYCWPFNETSTVTACTGDSVAFSVPTLGDGQPRMGSSPTDHTASADVQTAAVQLAPSTAAHEP